MKTYAGFYSTYEELKRGCKLCETENQEASFYSTYEELKPKNHGIDHDSLA